MAEIIETTIRGTDLCKAAGKRALGIKKKKKNSGIDNKCYGKGIVKLYAKSQGWKTEKHEKMNLTRGSNNEKTFFIRYLTKKLVWTSEKWKLSFVVYSISVQGHRKYFL